MQSHTDSEGSGMADGSPRRAPLVLAAIAGIALVLTVRAVTGGSDDGKGAPTADPSSAAGDCVVVHVTASSEKAALLTQIGEDWARTDPEVDGRCARVQVTSKASGGAADALAR